MNEFLESIPKGMRPVLLIILIVVFILIFKPWFSVPAGYVGVRFNRFSGDTSAHKQGTHPKMPVIHDIKLFDVRSIKTAYKAESFSSDMQDVTLDIEVIQHLVQEKVNEVYVKIGPDYSEKIINPALYQSAKSGTAKFPIEEIIAKRDELKQIIEETLAGKLASYNIVVESVNLVNITFSPDFTKSIEEKMIEAQKIKTAKNKRLQEEENKKATILKAQAEAESQRLLRLASSKEVVSLKWIEKWDGKLPNIMSGDGNALLIQPGTGK